MVVVRQNNCSYLMDNCWEDECYGVKGQGSLVKERLKENKGRLKEHVNAFPFAQILIEIRCCADYDVI